MAEISVIVPVYKVEKYLFKCVDSIVNQTFREIEIILVDDGSPDSCGKMCDQYAGIDNRIRVVHKGNGGLSSARNAGIEVATAPFIAFVDSDDLVAPQYFEHLHNLIRNNDADIAQCSFLKFYENVKVQHADLSLCQEKVFFSTDFLLDMVQLSSTHAQTVIACNKLYKKELFTGVRYPVGKIHEDEFTTYKLVLHSRKIVCSDAPLYYYLQRRTSITGRSFSLSRLDQLDALLEQLSVFQQMGLAQHVELLTSYIAIKCRELYTEVFFSDIKTKKEVLRKLFDCYCNYSELSVGLSKGEMKGSRKIFFRIFQISPLLGATLQKLRWTFWGY